MKLVCGNTTLATGTHALIGDPKLGVSPLPSVRPYPPYHVISKVPPEDGLYVEQGMVNTILPYCMVDDYRWSNTTTEIPCVTLENEHLKAVFLPGFGGRLWKLHDKDANREIFYENPYLRPGFLAVCNAWCAGGAEFNFGVRGHDAYTMQPLFCVALRDADDGTPVLRFFEYNRIRRTTYQLDFFLPENSHFLYNRVRVVNPNDETIPFYYWANIAVEEQKRQRIVVPAETTYVNYYLYESTDELSKHPLPVCRENFDATIPMNHPIARDNFFNLEDGQRRYELIANGDGQGTVIASTARLQGRKLFVWGMSNGGRHWQEHLLGTKEHTYVEVQAGLCKTQTECMPMPGHAVWEWLEAYGALSTDPTKIFGDWHEARSEALARLDAALPQQTLDDLLERTRTSIALRPAETRLQAGSGWGSLENARRIAAGEAPFEAQLDFGEPGELQAPWMALLEGKPFPCPEEDLAMPSYMVQPEFCRLLEAQEARAPKNWNLQNHLGVQAFYREEYDKAAEHFRKSTALFANMVGEFGLACTERVLQNCTSAAEHGEAAIRLAPSNVSLVKEIFRIFREFEEWKRMIRIYETVLPDSLRNTPMIRFLYAYAIAGDGDWRRSEAMIHEEILLWIPDIREGESTFSELFTLIRQREAEEKGLPFDPETVELPPQYDFRPSVPNR